MSGAILVAVITLIKNSMNKRDSLVRSTFAFSFSASVNIVTIFIALGSVWFKFLKVRHLGEALSVR